MPTKSYAIERGGPKRLTLDWQRGFKDIQVTFDGQPLGVILDQKALKEGARFKLPDGSTLDIYKKANRATISITQDGLQIPDSAEDPFKKVQAAGTISLSIAGFTLLSTLFLSNVLGRSADFGASDSITMAINVVLIVVYAGLGLLIHNRQRWALWVAMALYSLDTALYVLLLVQGQGRISAFGVILRAAFLFGLYQGFSGFGELDAEEATRMMKAKRPATTPADEERFKFTL